MSSNAVKIMEALQSPSNKNIIREFDAAFYAFEQMVYDADFTMERWGQEYYTHMTCGCGYSFEEVDNLIASIMDAMVTRAKQRNLDHDRTLYARIAESPDREGSTFFLAFVESIYGSLENDHMTEHGSGINSSWLHFSSGQNGTSYKFAQAAERLFIELWGYLEPPAEWKYRTDSTMGEMMKDHRKWIREGLAESVGYEVADEMLSVVPKVVDTMILRGNSVTVTEREQQIKEWIAGPQPVNFSLDGAAIDRMIRDYKGETE